jgi:hypothetical protein
MKTNKSDSKSADRRAFLKGVAIAGAVAASGAAVTKLAASTTTEPILKPATEDPATGETVVTPTSPLILRGSQRVGHVVLDGGQIVIQGGGEIHIDRLTKR